MGAATAAGVSTIVSMEEDKITKSFEKRTETGYKNKNIFIAD